MPRGTHQTTRSKLHPLIQITHRRSSHLSPSLITRHYSTAAAHIIHAAIDAHPFQAEFIVFFVEDGSSSRASAAAFAGFQGSVACGISFGEGWKRGGLWGFHVVRFLVSWERGRLQEGVGGRTWSRHNILWAIGL